MKAVITEQRRRNMQAIKASGTKVEAILAKSLWRKGYRYRKNWKELPGKPDIVFVKLKIAVFCDGDFWHGRNWEQKKERISSNKDYWIKKIERNIERDKEVNEILRNNGWSILRFWDKEILKQLDHCLKIIVELISEKQKNCV
jgi:DNA mismatch endonuclease (patch repair protein)